MKKIFLLIALTLLAVSTTSALEPLKVAIFKTGGAANVQVILNDYTGGTATAIYTGTPVSLTPNSSGIIVINVANNTSATDWADITATQVNSYYVLDILVGGTLYAQYRLDQQIINQSQGGVLDSDGNLTPPESGTASVGSDDNRWDGLYVTGNTLHVGPAGGMAGNEEMALSYDEVTNTGIINIDGNDEIKINSDGVVITGGIIANPTGTDDDFIFGDDDLNHLVSVERKFYFDKSKGAFRAGTVGGTFWDDGYVGTSSTAFGTDTKANGENSTALGSFTEATSYSSIAMGNGTRATGIASTAMGLSTLASGGPSTAMGNSSTASGFSSTAMGSSTIASGASSTAMGDNTTASGASSTAMGGGTLASGFYSTALGYSTEASESYSTAMGFNTEASGFYSTAFGFRTEASGSSSTAMGNNTTASGTSSTAMGFNTIADELYSTALGVYNDNTVTSDLLTVGNGTNNTNRSNAFEVYMNGDVVVPSLGNSSSTQNLQVDANGKFVTGGGGNAFTSAGGTTKSISQNDNFFFGQGLFTYSGPSEQYKLYYDISNGSFRTGIIQSTDWNTRGKASFGAGFNTDASGDYSVSMGNGTKADGDYSTAIGLITRASGNQSTALGYLTHAGGEKSIAAGYESNSGGVASIAIGDHAEAFANQSVALGHYTKTYGDNSLATGYYTTANGKNSTAMGYRTETNGENSTAMGVFTTAVADGSTSFGSHTVANAENSTAMGQYNISPSNGELLIIGNGTNNTNRSNAFEVYMNGDVVVPSLGNSSSTQNLQVDANGKFVTGGGGGGNLAYTEVTANTTLNTDSQVVFITGAYTVTLPASPATGQLIQIYSESTTATLDPQSKVFRDGGADYGISDFSDFTAGTNLSLYYNGTKWLPVARR